MVQAFTNKMNLGITFLPCLSWVSTRHLTRPVSQRLSSCVSGRLFAKRMTHILDMGLVEISTNHRPKICVNLFDKTRENQLNNTRIKIRENHCLAIHINKFEMWEKRPASNLCSSQTHVVNLQTAH